MSSRSEVNSFWSVVELSSPLSTCSGSPVTITLHFLLRMADNCLLTFSEIAWPTGSFFDTTVFGATVKKVVNSGTGMSGKRLVLVSE